jgi:hypothetical protein
MNKEDAHLLYPSKPRKTDHRHNLPIHRVQTHLAPSSFDSRAFLKAMRVTMAHVRTRRARSSAPAFIRHYRVFRLYRFVCDQVQPQNCAHSSAQRVTRARNFGIFVFMLRIHTAAARGLPLPSGGPTPKSKAPSPTAPARRAEIEKELAYISSFRFRWYKLYVRGFPSDRLEKDNSTWLRHTFHHSGF